MVGEPALQYTNMRVSSVAIVLVAGEYMVAICGPQDAETKQRDLAAAASSLQTLRSSVSIVSIAVAYLSPQYVIPPTLAQLAESPCQLNSPSHIHFTTVPSDITLLSQPTLCVVIVPLNVHNLIHSIVAQLSGSTVASTHPSARYPLLYRATATLNCYALCPLNVGATRGSYLV